MKVNFAFPQSGSSFETLVGVTLTLGDVKDIVRRHLSTSNLGRDDLGLVYGGQLLEPDPIPVSQFNIMPDPTINVIVS